MVMSFTLKCNKCGNEVEINSDNIDTYYIIFGWEKNGIIKDSDIRDKILISGIEADADETILCSCGNKVTYNA
jgi:hypothetical protein